MIISRTYIKQDNDLSYTIWRNKGRELKYSGCAYLPKVHRLLINAGSDINSGYEANQNRINYFRLTYSYKLVGMMLYEKLVERDINLLSLPSETVRLHLLQKYIQGSNSR